MNTNSPIATRSRGFTLIEVLIGIIVLGLGLLGLAAIFPAVVVQQRGASDAVQGESVAESAKSVLQGLEKLKRRGHGLGQRSLADAGGRYSFGATPVGPRDESRWELPFVTPNVLGAITSDSDVGSIIVGDEADTTKSVLLPVQSRLFPLPRRGATSTSDEPRYVWDFAVRRIIPTPCRVGTTILGSASPEDPLQVAIFVRRIDTAIRRAAPGEPGATMHDRFEPPTAGPLEYLPVVVGTDGVPTFDGRIRPGTVEYSGINEVSFTNPNTAGDQVTDRLAIDELNGNGLTPAQRPFYAQIGQKVLLDSGKVLTVIAIDENGRMVFDKRVDRTDQRRAATPGYFGLMTPQIPVAITTYTAGKPSAQ